jgi:isoleucyl-tRNA synthetase
LSRVVVVIPPERRERIARMSALVTDELNVKALEFAANETDLVAYKLLPDNRLLGPRLGARFPKVRAALAASPQTAVATLRAGKNLALDVDGQTVELEPNEVLITLQPQSGFAVQAQGEYVVALDTMITPELRAEGLAREFVRHVQDLRKSAGLDIADRIATHYTASEKLADAVTAFADYIKGETLSVELIAGAVPAGATIVEDAFDGEKVTIGVVRAA